ncbi:MAG TPA: hypothetical protein VF683_04820, partial [Chthoniobacterales bacterium]
RDFDEQVYHDAAATHLQEMPDDQFQSAARNAVTQVAPEDRQDLLGGLLAALASAGVARGLPGTGGGSGGNPVEQITRMLGIGTSDPRQMNEDDATKLMNYARKEQPDALRQTVAQKPWFVKAMGNPIVIGALTMAASRLLSRKR